MKKLLFVSLLIGISFASCKKCAECEVTVTTRTTGQPAYTGKSTIELCGSDLKEADGYTSTSMSAVNGYTSTITTKTECK